MKTTEYFKHVRTRPDRATIRDEWITEVVTRPERTEVQSDGRIRKWARIPEAGKCLRVILLEDGETVHNAFFDRSFGEFVVDFWAKGMERPVTILQCFEPFEKRQHFKIIGDPQIVIDGAMQDGNQVKSMVSRIQKGVAQHSKAGALWKTWRVE